MSNINDYFNEMAKYLENNNENAEKKEMNNLNRDELFEKFMMFQNYLQNQTPITVNNNPQPIQNNLTLSTSNNSEGSKNKEEKEPEQDHEDKQTEPQTQPKSFDDIPIQPKAKNFYELLETNLANEPDDIPQPSNKKAIKYEPRRRRTDMIQISAPNEQKKYKYYSQNFNKDFGKGEEVPEIVEVKQPEKKKE